MTMRFFHRALAFALLLLALGTHRLQAQDSPPVQQQRPPDPSAKSESAAPKLKKVWTNDDFFSRSGQVSGSAAEHHSKSTYSFSNGATFLTPANGQIVHPGEIVHFDVSIAPGRSEGPLGLMSPLGASNEIRESAPYSFSLKIPRDERGVGGGSPLIGIQPITAFGKVLGKQEFGLGGIEVDVEESEMPTKLSAYSGGRSQYGPPGLKFFGAGQQESLVIAATFSNGDVLNVINSTYVRLISENPKVVSVGEEGILTSLGPGNTTITVSYALEAQTMQISIPVSVTISNSVIVLNPLSLDFGDQPVGSTNKTLQVTLTNHSLGPITIYKFEIRAEVRESDDCTSAPLPPNGGCTISITFVPFRAGPSRGVIYILNSFSVGPSLPVAGNGI
jgi:hypothetical protein